jgi:hypothetical protein
MANINDTTTTTTADYFNETTDHPEWLFAFEKNCHVYINPILCGSGILFNAVSAVCLYSNNLHFQKSLVALFSFLNISDW